MTFAGLFSMMNGHLIQLGPLKIQVLSLIARISLRKACIVSKKSATTTTLTSVHATDQSNCSNLSLNNLQLSHPINAEIISFRQILEVKVRQSTGAPYSKSMAERRVMKSLHCSSALHMMLFQHCLPE